MVEDCRAVLRPDIVALAVERGRVVDHEEHLEDFLERHLLRVKGELDHLGVAGLARADLLVAGVCRLSPHVAGLDRFHALEVVEYGLQAPETASGQSGDFLPCVGHVVCLFLRLACYFVGWRPTTLQYAEFGCRPSPGSIVPTLGGIENESLAQAPRRRPRRPPTHMLRST